MQNKYLFGLAPDADLYSGNVTTDRIRCPGTGRLQFLLQEGAGGVGYGTITINAHIANSGGTPVPIAFRYKTALSSAEIDDSGGFTVAPTTGVLVAAGANKQVLVDLRADDLPAGYPFASLTMTETDSTAVDAVVVGIIKGGDYPGSGNTSL